jgi:F0F1-type ATP synthase membrane subunit c/vacuolar-type H+-ATPase subunit K
MAAGPPLSTEVMAFYFLGLPAVGALIALYAAMSSLREARERVLDLHAIRISDARVVVLLSVLATPLVFGFVLLVTYIGIEGNPLPADVALAAGQAFGIPALLLGIGYAILFLKGVGAAVLKQDTFVRTLVMAATIEVVIVFALIVSLTMLSAASPPPFGFVEAARTSSLYMMAGGTAAPMGAAVARRMWDFESSETWLKALIYQIMAVSYGALFLALSLLSLSGAI